MKNARQGEIIKIIQSMDVETQDQLLEELRARGYNTTQATISRDIKELRMVKELSKNGGYRYTMSQRKPSTEVDGRLRTIFKEGVVSAEAAQNLVVVRTMPGLASAACSALDGMEIAGMVGSLAGDDTGILIMRDNSAAQQFIAEIHKLLK